MPVTGKFAADFTDFHTAVQAAEVQLRSFDAGSNKVESSLERMTDKFSGRRVIQEAELMVKAVEAIRKEGDLTEKELESIGPVAAEALAKMKAMGIDVPPGLQKIADETKGITAAHDPLLGMLKNVALGFVAMFTARAAFDFVSKTLDEASALTNLSQQVRMGVEELQTLGGAMKTFGVDQETLGRGLFTLSQKIAGGDDSVARALAVMGISLKDVAGLQGEELFLAVMRGLSTLQGGLRDNTAIDLFGSRMGMAMAGAADGIEGALDAERRLATHMSTEATAALNRYGEAIDRAERSLSAMAANMMGPVAEGFNVIIDASERGASKFQIFWAMLRDWNATQVTGQTQTTALTALLLQQAQAVDLTKVALAAEAAMRTKAAAAVDTQSQAVRFLQTLEENAAGSLTATQTAHLQRLERMNALNAENAKGVGVTAAQYAVYVKSIEDAKKALTEEAAAVTALAAAHRATDAAITATTTSQIAQMAALQASRMKAYGTREQIVMLEQLAAAEHALSRTVFESLTTVEARAKVIKEDGERHAAFTAQKQVLEEKIAATINAGYAAEIAAMTRLAAARGLDIQGRSLQVDAAETLRRKQEELNGMAAAGLPVTAQQTLAMNEFAQALYDAAVAQDKLAQATQKAADEAKKEEVQIRKTTAAVAEFIGQSFPTSESLTKAGFLEGISSSGFMGSISGFGRQPAPGRARGGPVTAGMPYMVGEKEPELFVPDVSGSIVPGMADGGRGPSFVEPGQFSRGSSVTTLTISAGAIVINYPMMNDPRAKQELALLLGDALMARMKSLGLRMPSGA